MKLQSVHDGRLYASIGRTILGRTIPDMEEPGSFETVGRLPNPYAGIDGFRYSLVTAQPWKSLIGRVVGAYQTTNVWPITDETMLATAGRLLFVSFDGGTSWQTSRRLPSSSGLAGVLPTGVCVHDGDIYLGEYPLDNDATPRVLRSTDNGRTWTTVIELTDVRHVHSVQTDPYTGDLWITTGDTDIECRIGRLRDGRFDVVVSGDQRWRAVELVFTPSSIIWGMDCVYADRNHVFRLDRDEIDRTSTHPESVATVSNSVYFGTSFTVNGTLWVVLSTAVESGGDSTAPDKRSTDTSRKAMVIVSAATSGFTDWYEIRNYRTRRRSIEYIDYGGHLPSANAYVFLAADDDRGLFVNPYNTASDHGRIINVPLETFERVDETHPVL
jgi:hypothetical protein